MRVITIFVVLAGFVTGQRLQSDGVTECVFPFEFSGETHDDCVDFQGTFWCQNADGIFDTCLPVNGDAGVAAVDEPEDEPVVTADRSLTVPAPTSNLNQGIIGVVTEANRETPEAVAADTPDSTAVNGAAMPSAPIEVPSVLDEIVPADVQVKTLKGSDIVINEIASNDPVGGKDWFELYNKGDAIIDMMGWTVQDSDGNAFVIGGEEICQDPFLTEILPGSYLKFSRDIQCSFEFGFGLEDKIELLNPEGESADSISWASDATFSTLSIGRYPDGTDDIVLLQPTPGSTNKPASPFIMEAVAGSGDGLLGTDHECCKRLEKIGFNRTIPVMIVDVLGQPLFHKTNLTDEQWQYIIDNVDPAGSVLKQNSLVCTCSEYEDYDGWAGVQYRGQSSFREWDKKGLGIELREADNETNNNFPLLGLPRENDWVLNNPEKDNTLGFRSIAAYSLARQMGRYASRYRLMEVFLIADGATELSMSHYEGVYLLLEKVKRDKNRVAVKDRKPSNIPGVQLDITGGYIFKHDNNNIDPYDKWFQTSISQLPIIFAYPDVPTPEEMDYAFTFFNQFESSLLAANWLDPVEGYRQYIDYGAFIDYLLAVEITKNPDGYRGSTYMYKDVNSPLAMGPVWDVNEAFGICCGYPIEGYQRSGNSEGYSGGSAISPEGFRFLICVDANRCQVDSTDGVSQWYRRLWQDPDFRKDTYARWVELRKDAISNEYVNALFNDTTTYLREAAIRNYERWQGGKLFLDAAYPDDFEKEWLNDIEILRTWLIDHLDWMDKGWKRYSA
eukprot:TRINITY_DN19015_c0_g1_i1.p1 TRINITY_DN19015_c0_g1~~TRINITY_DN19015_c0_g1_i1.p1  ORF type:complete len:853 (-),score=100.36 TRINITY_DN19015_c0_g1_i1:526-2883(-)